MPSRSNSIVQLFSRSNSIVQSERTRVERQEHNQHQAFFKLPAELRLDIYSYCVQEATRLHDICLEGDDLERTFWSSRGDKFQWVYNPELKPIGRFPPLFGVCRQMRSEFIPVFFAKATAALLLHSIHRQKIFADVLCDRSISCISQIELHTSFKHTCWNDQRALFRYIVVEPVRVQIDWSEGSILVQSRKAQDGHYRPQCCRNAMEKAVERLVKEIQALELTRKDCRLLSQELKTLARRTETSLSKMWKF